MGRGVWGRKRATRFSRRKNPEVDRLDWCGVWFRVSDAEGVAMNFFGECLVVVEIYVLWHLLTGVW